MARGTLWPPGAAFGQDFEAQGARHGSRLHEFDTNRIAEPVSLAGARAHHGVTSFIKAEIFISNGSRRHKTIGTGIV